MKRVLDDLAIFCAVVEVGTLKGASEQLAIPHSTVSRRIEALENSLGLSLLHRTTREVRVTERGNQLYQDCIGQLNAVMQSLEFAIDAEVEFKGNLSVSLPVRAGIDFLGGWLIDFASEYPQLQLDISLSNTNKHLIKDEIDLAFRVGPLADSSAIALHLWDIPYQVYAQSAFITRYELDANQVTMQQLTTLPAVVSRPLSRWAFVDSNREELMMEPNAKLLVDDLGLARHAAQTGQYLCYLPQSMCAATDLVPLKIVDFKPRTRVMYAYYLGRRHAQSQIKTLVEYIKQRYRDN